MAPQLHQRPPFRAEHLGSLLRPQQLLDVKIAHEAGKVSDAELTKVEDKEITDIVNTQLKLGYPAASDGEYRRHSKNGDPRGQKGDAILTNSSVLGYFLPRSGRLRGGHRVRD